MIEMESINVENNKMLKEETETTSYLDKTVNGLNTIPEELDAFKKDGLQYVYAHTIRIISTENMDTILKATLQHLNIKVMGIGRFKSESNVWVLRFKDEDKQKVKELKQIVEVFHWGNLWIKNMDYCPIGNQQDWKDTRV